MKNPFKIIGYLILIGFGAAMFLLPTKVDVRREAELSVPLDSLFKTANDVRSWNHWSPWDFEKPNFKTTYSKNKSGVGAKYIWRSDSLSQMDGRLEITESDLNQRIKTAVFYLTGGETPAYESEFFFKQGNKSGSSIISWEIKDEVGWFHLPNRFLIMGAEDELDKMMDSSFTKLQRYINR